MDLGQRDRESDGISAQLLPRINKKRNHTESQSKRYKTEEDNVIIENQSQYPSPEKTASIFKVKKDRIINEILQSKLPSLAASELHNSKNTKSQKKNFFTNNQYIE